VQGGRIQMKIMKIMTRMQVAEYYKQGIKRKPEGYGEPNKVSTSTCMVCLQDPKTYCQVIITCFSLDYMDVNVYVILVQISNVLIYV
jgi:hypothetical protein